MDFAGGSVGAVGCGVDEDAPDGNDYGDEGCGHGGEGVSSIGWCGQCVCGRGLVEHFFWKFTLMEVSATGGFIKS